MALKPSRLLSLARLLALQYTVRSHLRLSRTKNYGNTVRRLIHSIIKKLATLTSRSRLLPSVAKPAPERGSSCPRAWLIDTETCSRARLVLSARCKTSCMRHGKLLRRKLKAGNRLRRTMGFASYGTATARGDLAGMHLAMDGGIGVGCTPSRTSYRLIVMSPAGRANDVGYVLVRAGYPLSDTNAVPHFAGTKRTESRDLWVRCTWIPVRLGSWRAALHKPRFGGAIDPYAWRPSP